MALGASRSDVLTMVLRGSAVAVGLGLVVGLAASSWLGSLMTSLLFTLVVFVASLVPALRAASVDPTTALRAD